MVNNGPGTIGSYAVSITRKPFSIYAEGDHAVLKITRLASVSRPGWKRLGLFALPTATLAGLFAAVGCGGGGDSGPSGLPLSKASQAQVLRGRALVTTMGCIDCHNRGKNDPSDPQWLAGVVTGNPQGVFDIGPFKTYAANITPDVATGLGGVSDRQVFNALRYGLAPAESPDAIITGSTPGVGNFPASPVFLAPPMPWTSTRHLTDDDTWAIVAYLKHGIKAVSNAVPESQSPPDHWASSYTDAAVGPKTLPPYPTASEVFAP